MIEHQHGKAFVLREQAPVRTFRRRGRVIPTEASRAFQRLTTAELPGPSVRGARSNRRFGRA